ncbi:hypothetical protein [Spirosoma rigui]|uniref:hypothetical protein n=1 Tax=Spirosoma rigui TaxID=564064 RepID=UPI0012D31975|nr:hypothetical protein [Spirosoma rigui]
MKTAKVTSGPLGREKRFVIVQDSDFLVTAYAVNKDSGITSNYGILLGKFRNIDDVDVHNEIIDRLEVIFKTV